MLPKLLINKYTIFIDFKKGRLQGSGVLKTKEGIIIPEEIKTEDIDIINGLESIKYLLEQGNTLQLYNEGYNYNATIGKITKEGPYGENNCLEVLAEGEGVMFEEALFNLNNESAKLKNDQKPKILAKKYKVYGKTKYTNLSN